MRDDAVHPASSGGSTTRCGGWKVDTSTLRKQAKKIANNELDRWAGKVETNGSMQPVLASNRHCVGWETHSTSGDPWSAASTSTVMAWAGAGSDFEYSPPSGDQRGSGTA